MRHKPHIHRDYFPPAERVLWVVVARRNASIFLKPFIAADDFVWVQQKLKEKQTRSAEVRASHTSRKPS